MIGEIGAVLAALGGRFGWRFWWPLVPWAADLAMVATFRRDSIQEPAGVLLLACIAMVPVLFLWGARFAIALGYARRRVYPVLIATCALMPMIWQLVGSLLRMVTGHSDGGRTEGAFLLYGLPIIALFVLGCALGLGYGLRGVGWSVVSWGGVAALFYLVLWPFLQEFGQLQFYLGTLVVLAMVIGAISVGWHGFRIARA